MPRVIPATLGAEMLTWDGVFRIRRYPYLEGLGGVSERLQVRVGEADRVQAGFQPAQRKLPLGVRDRLDARTLDEDPRPAKSGSEAIQDDPGNAAPEFGFENRAPVSVHRDDISALDHDRLEEGDLLSRQRAGAHAPVGAS